VRNLPAGVAAAARHPRIAAAPAVLDLQQDPQRGGAGLGLAICREIVLAHGGRIEVTSEDGRGNIFTFSIPMRDGGTDTNEGRAEFGK
jgi:K+-sensing histidine kinase KdpD